MSKIPIIDENDLNSLIEEALKGNGVLATPTEVSQMLNNLQGISINSKPRRDGRFQGYIIEKQQKKYVYGKTREEVAIKIRYWLKNGLPQKKERNVRGNVPTTFNAFAQYYFENFRVKKVAVQTFYHDKKRYEKYLLPAFGETPLKKITPIDCQQLLDNISNDGKGKTADEIYSLLSVIFKMAIKHNIISHNPLDIIFHVQHERKHGKALTKDEENTLKTALNGSPYLSACMLALYTGLRPNELKTARVDGNFIIAVNSKRKTKAVEYKRIPISEKLAPYIDGQPFRIPGLNYLRMLIRETLPGHILYDLRTTFYSRCKECNISEHAINAFMGHSLGALGNAYTDLSDDFLIKEMAKFTY